MNPAIIAALIAGGAKLTESAYSNYKNMDLNRENRRFQRDMSNTAHRREVKDLIAAGLNPILSAKYGGSSTPPTSAAQIMPSGAVETGVQTYQGIKGLEQQKALNEATQSNLTAQAEKARADAAYTRATTPGAVGEQQGRIAVSEGQVKNLLKDLEVKESTKSEIAKRIQHYSAQIALLKEQTQTEKVRAQKEKATAVFWSWIRKATEGLDNASRSLIEKALKSVEGSTEFFDEEGNALPDSALNEFEKSQR